MQKKAVWIAVVAAVIVLIGVVLLRSNRHAESTPPPQHASALAVLKVGAALPLTGDAAVYGQAIKNGIELALEEHNKSKTPRLAVVYEDDQYLPKMSVSAVQKLIQVDRVPVIIGGAGSTTAEPITPIVTESKVVLVSPCATAPSLTGASPFFFRLWPSDTYEGGVLAETAIRTLGVKRLAILYVNAPYGKGITDVFTKRFQELGGTVSVTESYAQGATDFRTQLTKIKADGVDWLFLPGYIQEVTNILKQSVQLGLHVRFLGVNSLYDPNLLQVAGTAAEGAVFAVQTYDPASDDPTISHFVKSYETKFGTKPDAFAATGYDALRVVARAIELANGVSGSAIRDGMAKVKDFPGPSGVITFDQNGDVKKPLMLMTVQDGAFRLMGR